MKNKSLAKRVKELRKRKGLAQEELAENSGLSLRTIQRIENGESEPTGNTLKKLSNALNVSPNELTDWQIREDKNVILLLNLSQLSFLAFPLLGAIIPLMIWTSQKDKVKDVDRVGKSILNFQISWSLAFFLVLMFFPIIAKPLKIVVHFHVFTALYLINGIIVIMNTIRYHKGKSINYIPAFSFLR